MGVNDTLIPVRFLVLTGHLIAIILVFFSKSANIVAALPTNYTTADFNSLDQSITWALALSLVFLAIEYVVFFGGFSMFLNFMNLIYIFLHFIGAIITAAFILDSWPYYHIWYLFAFCCLVPGVCELVVLVLMVGCKIKLA